MHKSLLLAPLFLIQCANVEKNLVEKELIETKQDITTEISYQNIPQTDQAERVEIIPSGFTRRIGRLEMTGGTVCTATLIGENLILTADHCAENKDLTTRSPEDFTFYAGFSRGEYIAKSDITGVIAPDSTSANGWFDSKIKFSFDDIAVLVLAEPLGKKLGFEKVRTDPLPDLPNGTQFQSMQIGYNREYGKRMTGDIDCELIEHFINPNILSSRCKVSAMDSGSPQFIWLNNQRQIVGVTSQKIPTGSMVSPTHRSKVIQQLKLK